jgi:hypothetical protein
VKDINRSYVPDLETSEFLHKIYLQIRSAPNGIDKWAKQGAFESIAACEESWRVVGISEDALRHIGITGTNADLQRGHWFAREQRYNALFGKGTEPMDQQTLISFFFEHDTTVVITKNQNSARGDHTSWGRIIPVPPGLFGISGYGFKVRKGVELPWVRHEIAQLDSMPSAISAPV